MSHSATMASLERGQPPPAWPAPQRVLLAQHTRWICWSPDVQAGLLKRVSSCRDAPGVGHYEMEATPESSPVHKLGQGRDSVSLEVTSRGMGRPFTYSVQFVAPCLVRYYMPGVRSCS